jgi:glycerol-3-phosphate acyltransferase PlsX
VVSGQEPELASPVIVDAMGGDFAPSVVVRGATQAAREHGIPVALVGRQEALLSLLPAGRFAERVTIVHAPEVVGMEEEAVAGVRHRAGSSIVVAMEMLRAGRGCAVVSAGHSGALVAAAVLYLGRLPGIERPGIAIPFPTMDGRRVLLIDAGAVVDPRATWLVQHAVLACGYVRVAWRVPDPRVGLLSNGEEPGKGNRLVRETHQLLAQALGGSFAGNIEPHRIPEGLVDVVVCDGFSGNILLKTAEGVASLVQRTLSEAARRHWYTRLAGLILRSTLRGALQRLDYRTYGGAPLLGVNGLVYIAHGRSDAEAIRQAILAAASAARAGLATALEQIAPGYHPAGQSTLH